MNLCVFLKQYLISFFFCIVLLSCRTLSESTVKTTNWELAFNYAKSIGVIIEKTDDQDGPLQSGSYGTGFIVYEDADKYIGITAEHVWNPMCNDKACRIAFPKTEVHDSWEFYDIAPYSEIIDDKLAPLASVSTEKLRADEKAKFPGDYFFFEVKKGTEPLTPLPLTFVEVPLKAMTMIVGYPAGSYRPDDYANVEDASPYLIQVDGAVTLTVDNQFLMTSVAASGASGSPIFVWDGDQSKVAGVYFMGSMDPTHVEIGSKLSARRAFAIDGRRLSLGDQLKQIASNHPRHSLIHNLVKKSSNDATKIRYAGDLALAATNFKLENSGFNRGGLIEGGFKVSLDTNATIDDPKNLYFNGIALPAFESFKSSKTADGYHYSFFVAPKDISLFSFFEYGKVPNRFDTTSCFVSETWVKVSYEFGDDGSEMVDKPGDPKWQQPKYAALKKAYDDYIDGKDSIKFFCGNTEALHEGEIARVWRNEQ